MSAALSRPQNTYCKNALYWDHRAGSPISTAKIYWNISWTLIFDDNSLCIVYTKEEVGNIPQQKCDSDDFTERRWGRSALHQNGHIWGDRLTRHHGQEAMRYDQLSLAFTLFLQFIIGCSLFSIQYFSHVCDARCGPGVLNTCLACLMANLTLIALKLIKTNQALRLTDWQRPNCPITALFSIPWHHKHQSINRTAHCYVCRTTCFHSLDTRKD